MLIVHRFARMTMTLAETIIDALRPMTDAEIAALSDELLAFNYCEAVENEPEGDEVDAFNAEIVRRWIKRMDDGGSIWRRVSALPQRVRRWITPANDPEGLI